MTGLLTALAGANVIYGLGMIESGITFDYGQLIMDDEFAAMIKQAVRGMAVNDETLSVELINEIGPFKDYLSHKSTFQHMRSMSQPTIIDRRHREKWTKAGSKDLYEAAWDKARDLLENYEPPQLSQGVQQDLRTIVNETEKELGVPISSE
jgi:trimethylamine--corrinoid protein Co-methyltransferase